MNKKFFVLFACLLAMASLSFALTFNITGRVIFSNGSGANNVNISVFNETSIGALNYYNIANVTNSSGHYTISFDTTAQQATSPYLLTFKLRNSSNDLTHMGPLLPRFPAQMYGEMFSSMNVTIYPAATLRINGSRRVNVTNATEISVNFSGALMDSKYGFMIENFFPRDANGDANWNVSIDLLRDRNYTLTVMKIGNFQIQERGAAPRTITVSQTNLTSHTGANNSFRLAVNLTDIPVNYTGNLTVNVSGINNAGINYTAIMLYPYGPNGKIYIGQFGAISATAFGTAPGGNDFGGYLNRTGNSASYNLTLMGTSGGISYLLAIFAYNGSAPGQSGTRYFVAFQNITVTNTDVSSFNLTMYELTGIYIPTTSPNDVNITRFIINLKNNDTSGQQAQLRNVQTASVEGIINYTDPNGRGPVNIAFLAESNSSGAATIPIIKDTRFKFRIFNHQFAPVKKTLNSTSNTSTIELTGQKFTKPNSTETFTSLQMFFLKSNATCDIQQPDLKADTEGGCQIANFTAGTQGNFNPMKIMMSGENLNLMVKDTSTGIIAMFVGTDLFASGPPNMQLPDSALADNTVGTAFDKAWRFGSLAPEVFRYALIGIPYTDAEIEDTATMKVRLKGLYDEDWNSQWSSATQSESALPAEFGDYNQTFFNSSTGGMTCTEAIASDCYINKTANIVWLRVPHFSGSDPAVSGVAKAAASAPSTGDTVVSRLYSSTAGLPSIGSPSLQCPDNKYNGSFDQSTTWKVVFNLNSIASGSGEQYLFDNKGAGTYYVYAPESTTTNYKTFDLSSTCAAAVEEVQPVEEVTPETPTEEAQPTEETTPEQPAEDVSAKAVAAVANAVSAIDEAKAAGKDVSAAQAKLTAAQVALNSGNFEEAARLAAEAAQLARSAPAKVTAPVKETTKPKVEEKPSAPAPSGELPLLPIAIVVLVVIVAAAYFLFMRGGRKGYYRN